MMKSRKLFQRSWQNWSYLSKLEKARATQLLAGLKKRRNKGGNKDMRGRERERMRGREREKEKERDRDREQRERVKE